MNSPNDENFDPTRNTLIKVLQLKNQMLKESQNRS